MPVVGSALAKPAPGQIERWRLRHAYPDAVGIWASSSGVEAGAFAFNAIAQDPQVLHRAARVQAVRMAANAEEFLSGLDQSGMVSNDVWRAVLLFVRQAIDEWRNVPREYNRGGQVSYATSDPGIARAPAQDPWQAAWRKFPQVDDATGQLATRILREFGVATLQRARKPWDHVIALAVLRYAARQLRGALMASSRDAVIADIGTVRSYAEQAGLSPLLVGCTGPGKPAQQALGLSRDARTLREVDPRACWQEAIDFHAFALVALDHRLLLNLPLDEAEELAAAAIRLADAAPGTLIVPNLPPTSASSSKVVKLHALGCLRAR